jgi:hypothetical protein
MIVVEVSTQHNVNGLRTFADDSEVVQKIGLEVTKYVVLTGLVSAETRIDQDSLTAALEEEALKREQQVAIDRCKMRPQPLLALDARYGSILKEITRRIDQRVDLHETVNARLTDRPSLQHSP